LTKGSSELVVESNIFTLFWKVPAISLRNSTYPSLYSVAAICKHVWQEVLGTLDNSDHIFVNPCGSLDSMSIVSSPSQKQLSPCSNLIIFCQTRTPAGHHEARIPEFSWFGSRSRKCSIPRQLQERMSPYS
jgi:hypothetical protein